MKLTKMKIAISTIGVFCLLIGSIFYYASTKLRPDEIKRMTIEQTKKVFPRSEVSLDAVNIDWGFNFKVNVQKFKIEAVKDNSKFEMLAVDQLVIKIPVWSILTNSGIIEVKLDSPLLNYTEFAENNNWTYALGEQVGSNKVENLDSTNSTKNSSNNAIDFFGKSKLNIRFSDVQMKYSLRDNSSGEVKVSKFLIKGLNFESLTAFELASNVNFVMKDKSKLSFDTLAIGQFNISDYVKNGSVSSNINIKISNLQKTGLDFKFPDVLTDVDINIKNTGEILGKIHSSFESQNKITANFKMAKQVDITDINVDIVMKDIAAIIGLDKTIDMSKAKLQAKGNIIYSNDKKLIPNLSFNIFPGIGYSKEGIVANTSVTGEMHGSEISGKAKTDVLDGTVVSTMSGTFDPNQKFDMTKLKPFDIKVVATGMKIPEKLIRSKLWDKKPKEETEEKDAREEKDVKNKTEALAKKDADSTLPPANVSMDWSNINVGGEDFSGHGRIVTSGKTIAIDNMNFKFSKGTGKLTQTMILGKNQNESKFSFEIQNLNLSSFKAFLPPFIENFIGTFSGKVAGGVTMFSDISKMPNYDIMVSTEAKNGEIKKLNIGEYVNPMLANIPVVKDQVKDKQIKVNGDFETFSLKGRFTNSQYSLSSFEFVGINKKVSINGNGEIYPIAGNKQSEITASFSDGTGKISDILQKNTGSKVLPLHLIGPGFTLKPDYQYTIGKLAKGAMKTKGEDKLKEVVQKNLDKVVPEKAKEKVKGILNGLFKK